MGRKVGGETEALESKASVLLLKRWISRFQRCSRHTEPKVSLSLSLRKAGGDKTFFLCDSKFFTGSLSFQRKPSRTLCIKGYYQERGKTTYRTGKIFANDIYEVKIWLPGCIKTPTAQEQQDK